jgi:hypothetical protein
MNKDDFDQFGVSWRAASEVYNVTPTDAALGLTFKVLAKYDLHDVKMAIADYLATGQFPPKPADIVSRLSNKDGRPSADEAWSIAIESFDEYKTVVMNDEISIALTQAQGIYNDGDKVGARMAFKAAYDRSIAQARSDGIKPKWWPSIGIDKAGRRPALEKAVISGLLPELYVNNLLPSPLVIDPKKLIEGAKEEAFKQLNGAIKC